MKKIKYRRLPWLITGAVLTVIVLTLSFRIRENVVTAFHMEVKNYIKAIERESGLKITYQKISPSLLNKIALENVDLFINDKLILSIDQFIFQYNIRSYFDQSVILPLDIWLYGAKIWINNVTINEIKEIVARYQTGSPDASAGWSGFTLPRINADNISVEYSRTGAKLTGQIDNFVLMPLDNSHYDYTVELQSSLQYEQPAASGRWSTDLSFAGLFNSEQPSLMGNCDINGLKTPYLDIRNAALFVRADPGMINIRKVSRSLTHDIDLTWLSVDNSLTMRAQMDNYVPARMLETHFSNPYIYHLLASRYDGKLSLRYTLDSRQLAYSGDFSLQVYKSADIFFYDGMKLRINGSGDIEKVTLREFSVSIASAAYVSYSGEINFNRTEMLFPRLLGKISAVNWPLINHGLTFSSQISGDGSSYSLHSQAPKYGNLEISQFFIKLKRETGGAIVLNAGSLLNETGKFSLNAVFSTELSKPYLSMSVSLDNAAGLPFSSTFLGDDYNSLIPQLISAKLYLTSDFEKYSYYIPALTLFDKQGQRFIHSRWHGNNRQLTLQRLNAGIYEQNFQVSGSLRGLESDTLEFNAVVNGKSGKNYVFNGIVRNGNRLLVRGSHKFLMLADFSRERELLSLKFEQLPVSVNNFDTLVDMKMVGINKEQGWAFFCDYSRVYEAQSDRMVEVSGSFSENELKLSRIVLSSGGVSLSGYGSAYLKMEHDFFNSRLDFTFGDQERKEYYRIAGELSGQKVDFNIQFSNAILSRWSGDFNRGTASGVINAVGDPLNPRIDIELITDRAIYGGQPFFSNMSLRFYDMRLQIINSAINSNKNFLNEISGEIDMKNGSAKLRGILLDRGSAEGQEILLAGDFMNIDRLDELAHFSLEGLAATIEITSRKDPDSWWLFSLFYLRERWFLEADNNQRNLVIDGFIENEGDFFLRFRQPFPLQATIAGYWDGSRIDLDCRIHNLDVRPFTDLTDLGFMRINDGRISGNLSLKGEPANPTINGSLLVSKAKAAVLGVVNEVTAADSLVTISDNIINIDKITIYSDQTPLYLSAVFRLDQLALEKYQVSIDTNYVDKSRQTGSTQVMNYIQLALDIPPLSLNGKVGGLFTVAGDSIETNFGGDIMLADAVVNYQQGSDSFDYSTALVYGAQSSVKKLDLRLTTGRDVKFIWPNSQIPLLYINIAEGETIDVLFGTSTSAVIAGEIGILSGKVNYLQNSFNIIDGRLFFQRRANTLTPIVSLTGTLYEYINNEPLVISLNINENSVFDLNPSFTSNPPLDNQQILAVLSGGSVEETNFSPWGATGDFIGNLILIDVIEARLKEYTSLDVVSVNTLLFSSFIENTLFADSGSEQSGVDTNNWLSYLDQTSLVLGKYLTDNLYIGSQFLLNYESSNNSTDNRLTVNPELILNWDSPLANFDLSISPNLFDNSRSNSADINLGISWNFNL